VVKSLINRVDEKQYVIPLSRRQPFYYCEYSSIIKHNDSVRILKKDGDVKIEYDIPIANIGCLIIGPGTSITTESIRIISARGCHCVFTGEGGVPIYSKTIFHRNSTNKYKQFKLISDKELRFKAANILLSERQSIINKFKPDLPALSLNSINNQNYMAIEAVWAKSAYRYVCSKNNYTWVGKSSLHREHPLNLMNHLLYSITDVVISYCGFEPDMGVIHGRVNGGGLCYDIADIYKPILTLEQAILHDINKSASKQIKESLLSDILKFDIIDSQIKILTEIFK
jgi:CRISPR-associated protein Cas1